MLMALQPHLSLEPMQTARFFGATLALSAFLLSPSAARAEPRGPQLVQERDRFMDQRNGGVAVLAGWSAVSLVGGTLFLIDPPWLPEVAPTSTERRAFGIATLSFAAVNAAFVVSGLVNTTSLERSLVTLPDVVNERRSGATFFAVNAGLDMLYIAGGAMLAQSETPVLRGLGAGVLTQGGFLIGFDVTSAMTYRFGGW